MGTTHSSESKAGRWSPDLAREIEAIEVMELLRVDSRDREEEAELVSREMLSEMGRRLEAISVAPPAPPPRRALPASWLALVAAVAVLSAICAHAFATMRVGVDIEAIAAPVPAVSIAAPTAIAPAPGATLAPSDPIAAPVAAPVVEPEQGEERSIHTERIEERAVHEEPIATAGAIPDNPYAADSETPSPAAAALSPSADPIDALVGSALVKPGRSAASAAAPATNDLPDGARGLPELPSRAEVSRAMDAVARQVRECGAGADGRLVVELRIAGATGRVRDAKTVDGQWRGTSAGACAARAVRVAVLPRFAARDLVVRYPFDI